MSAERSIEVTGDSVEDAIAKGLAQLGVGPAEVIVEVLEEPKQAMFGMDASPARVRLQLLGLPPASPSVSTPSPAPSSPPAAVSSDEPARERPHRPPQEHRDRERGRGGQPPRRSAPPRRPRERVEPLDAMDEEPDESLPMVDVGAEIPENELEEEAQVAKVVVNELLERMDIRARIAVRRSTPDDQSGAAPYIFDIMSTGNSGRLIGRKGETLAALQYITRLITSRELQRRADVIVDVNSYKARRAQALTNLALRMADDAISSGKTVSLEPMPPHERRIVHLALRDRTDVSTRSVGEGTARKVTIVPTSPEA